MNLQDHARSVSIVIPTFNRARYLPKAIDSSLAQTYKCQIVVCDHGSSDNTQEIVSQYQNSNVIYIRREKDFGPHFCWLEGVINCDGEYVHLQFDDDWIAPNFIEECMALFNKDVGCVLTRAKLVVEVDEFNKDLPSISLQGLKTGIYDSEYLENLLVNKHLMISPGAAIFRKKDIIDGLYQGNLPLDNREYHGAGPDHFIMLITLLRYKHFGYVDQDLAFFRGHETSITWIASHDEDKSKKIDFAYRAVRDYYKILKKGRLYLKMLQETNKFKKIIMRIKVFFCYLKKA